MSLAVTRFPYRSCPYRWILVVQEVSTGAGDVTDGMCESLNGRFKLDFYACLSNGDSLVWASECLADGPEPADRVRSRWFLEYHISDERWTLNSLRAIQYPAYELDDDDPCDGDEKVLSKITSSGGDTDGCDVSPATVTITRSCPPERDAREHKRSTRTGQLKRKCGCDCNDEPDDKRYKCSTRNDGGDGAGGGDCCPCYASLEWTVGGFVTPPIYIQPGNWPILRNEQHYPTVSDPSLLTDPAGLNDNFGPGAWGDHATTWVIPTGFIYPKWVWRALLSVSCDPVTCMASWTFSYYQFRQVSVTGTYFWSVAYTGSTPLDEYGCGKLPITLTRPPGDIFECDILIPAYCLPVTVPDEITLTPSGGCDSPMVIDCGEGEYEEPPFNPDDCLYPDEITTCCDYCEGMDQPCAYIAEFECDISNPDAVMSGYTVLAARQVVLRQECPFDDTCEWVAVGPSSNPDDGGVGAQPVCATCWGTCPETGCTWQSWSAGPCPADDGGGCGPLTCPTDATFTVAIGEIRGVSNEVVVASDSATLANTGLNEWTGTGASVRVSATLAENCEGLSMQVGYLGGTTLSAGYNLVSGSPIDCGADIVFQFDATQNSGSTWPSTVTLVRV